MRLPLYYCRLPDISSINDCNKRGWIPAGLGGATANLLTSRAVTVSEITGQESVALASARAAKLFVHRVWPSAVLGFGLGLTAVWMFVLVYGTIERINILMDTAF